MFRRMVSLIWAPWKSASFPTNSDPMMDAHPYGAEQEIRRCGMFSSVCSSVHLCRANHILHIALLVAFCHFGRVFLVHLLQIKNGILTFSFLLKTFFVFNNACLLLPFFSILRYALVQCDHSHQRLYSS